MKFLAAPAFLVTICIATPTQAADIHKNNCGVFRCGAAMRRTAFALAVLLATTISSQDGRLCLDAAHAPQQSFHYRQPSHAGGQL
jgi:hypothetical protein